MAETFDPTTPPQPDRPRDDYQREFDRYGINQAILSSLQRDLLRLTVGVSTGTVSEATLIFLRANNPEEAARVEAAQTTGVTDTALQLRVLDEQIQAVERSIEANLATMDGLDPIRFQSDFPGFSKLKPTGGGASVNRVPITIGGQTFMVTGGEALRYFQDQEGQVQILVPDQDGNPIPLTVDANTAFNYYSDLAFQGTVSADTAATIQGQAERQNLDIDFQREILDINEKEARRAERIQATEFATETALALQGLDLQSRSLEIQALSNALAAEIDIGRLTYDEARLQLDRVRTAMDQRRQDQLLLVESALKQSSLRTDPVTGELVSQLPFSEQLTAAFSQAFGQTFQQDQFSIAAGVVNPQQAGQDVIGSTEFRSPIPGLTQSLVSTTDAIQGILGQDFNAGDAAKATIESAASNLIEST